MVVTMSMTLPPKRLLLLGVPRAVTPALRQVWIPSVCVAPFASVVSLITFYAKITTWTTPKMLAIRSLHKARRPVHRTSLLPTGSELVREEVQTRISRRLSSNCAPFILYLVPWFIWK